MPSPEVLRARLRDEIELAFPVTTLATRQVEKLVSAIVQITFDHLTAKANEVFDNLEPIDGMGRDLAEVAWTAISKELEP